MEQREKTLLEAAVGAVFVALLIVASIMVVGAYGNNEEETRTGTTIINSYNTNSFNTYSQKEPLLANRKPYIVDTGRKYVHDDRVFYVDDNLGYDHNLKYSKDKSDRYLKYDDFGNFRTYKGILQNDVDNYEVYVRNREYTGGYFKTVFYFEDYYGNVNSESVTNYIPAKDEKKFFYRDVSPSRYEYRNWWYTVEPLTKVKTESYGKGYGHYKIIYPEDSGLRAYSYPY